MLSFSTKTMASESLLEEDIQRAYIKLGLVASSASDESLSSSREVTSHINLAQMKPNFLSQDRVAYDDFHNTLQQKCIL